MTKELYLPTDYIDNYCVVINNGYYRVYTNRELTSYTDIYYDNHYLERKGSSNYSYTGTCDIVYTYTDNFYRRFDITDILIIFVIFALINVILIGSLYKVFSRGRRLK